MTHLVKHAGVWKESEPYVKHNGVWKPLEEGHIKHAGVWKEYYSAEADPMQLLGGTTARQTGVVRTPPYNRGDYLVVFASSFRDAPWPTAPSGVNFLSEKKREKMLDGPYVESTCIIWAGKATESAPTGTTITSANMPAGNPSAGISAVVFSDAMDIGSVATGGFTGVYGALTPKVTLQQPGVSWVMAISHTAYSSPDDYLFNANGISGLNTLFLSDSIGPLGQHSNGPVSGAIPPGRFNILAGNGTNATWGIIEVIQRV